MQEKNENYIYIIIIILHFFAILLGEPFTQEETEEMLSAAVDPDKGAVYYKDYVSLMVVEDDGI